MCIYFLQLRYICGRRSIYRFLQKMNITFLLSNSTSDECSGKAGYDVYTSEERMWKHDHFLKRGLQIAIMHEFIQGTILDTWFIHGVDIFTYPTPFLSYLWLKKKIRNKQKQKIGKYGKSLRYIWYLRTARGTPNDCKTG